MFGSGYEYTDELPKAIEGEHLVQLGKCEEKVMNGYNVLVAPISFVGKEGRVIPDRITFVEPTPDKMAEYGESFNRKLSKFQACFNIHGAFNPENYRLWEGHRGTVVIGKNKKDFLEVVDFKKNSEWVNPNRKSSDDAIF